MRPEAFEKFLSSFASLRNYSVVPQLTQIMSVQVPLSTCSGARICVCVCVCLNTPIQMRTFICVQLLHKLTSAWIWCDGLVAIFQARCPASAVWLHFTARLPPNGCCCTATRPLHSDTSTATRPLHSTATRPLHSLRCGCLPIHSSLIIHLCCLPIHNPLIIHLYCLPIHSTI